MGGIKNTTRAKQPGAFFGYAIIFISIAGFLGWILGFPFLRKVLSTNMQVNPISAVLFLLSGIALLHIRTKRSRFVYCVVPSAIICLVALLKLSAFVTGWDTHIDAILFQKSLDGNRMAPNSAINFFLCGLSIILVSRGSEKSIIMGHILALFCFLISALALMGYIYSIRSLYDVREYIPMAIQAAASFLLICAGIFTSKPKNGLIAIISADRLGGMLSRRLLPVAILLPMFLGYLCFESTRYGIFSQNLSVSVLIIIIILAFSIIIWMYARSLNHIDTEWRESEKRLVIAKNTAEKARKAQEQFLANMSHEIRTPMNGVIGMTSLLQSTPLNEDQLSYVETIRVSGESLLVIINDILDFSKIEAGKLELEQHPFSIHTAIEDTFDLLAKEANEKNIDLLYTIESSVPATIVGDITRLRQILVNLVSNGIKFTERGEILVSVLVNSIDNDTYELEFSVKDTGIGIPEDKLDRLFKAFSQADESTTRKYGGTGLGLAICNKLVQMMQGRIAVESRVGVGSVFFFTAKFKIHDQPAELATSNYVNLKGKTILIVDDNATNLIILQKNCEKWDMRVTIADSGQKALELIEDKRFDLVITDMMMPEMDGNTLATLIKQKDSVVPIVLLSSASVLNGHEFGGDRLFAVSLMKPVRLFQSGQVLNGIFEAHANISGKAERTPAKDLATLSLSERIPLRILVAEDNMINQKIALKILEKLGYFADLAANGLETVEAMNRQHYDLILMDMIMPEMDGLEATREIRKMPLKHQPVIIALTANAMQGEKEKCIESGMNDFLPKPFQIHDLENIIVKWEGLVNTSI